MSTPSSASRFCSNMSTPSSADCSSPLAAMKRYDSPSPLLLHSPLCVADYRAIKRKTRANAVADLRRRLDFDSDEDCCTPPPPSRKGMENVTVAVRRRLDFDSALPPPPRKSRMNLGETVGRKLDFDSAAENAGTPQRLRSFDCIANAIRRCPPPDFPAVRWNRRAMKSYFNNLAPINLR